MKHGAFDESHARMPLRSRDDEVTDLVEISSGHFVCAPDESALSLAFKAFGTAFNPLLIEDLPDSKHPKFAAVSLSTALLCLLGAIAVHHSLNNSEIWGVLMSLGVFVGLILCISPVIGLAVMGISAASDFTRVMIELLASVTPISASWITRAPFQVWELTALALCVGILTIKAMMRTRLYRWVTAAVARRSPPGGLSLPLR